MTRAEINTWIAQSSNVDVATTERVLEGLERVVLSQVSGGGLNKFGKIMALYQDWKRG